MNRKIVAVNNIKQENGLVVWNNPAYSYGLLASWLCDNNDFEWTVPAELHKVYLEYKSIIDNLSQPRMKSVTDIIDDVLQTFPPKKEDETSYGYANHLAIFKIGVLINIIYRQGYDNPERIMEMLEKLVAHANTSDAECLQVSVHYACKFFINMYPEFTEEIRAIIAKEKHQKPNGQIDRGTAF